MEHAVSVATRTAIILALGIALLGLFEGANVATDHLDSPDFPSHARFHATLGGVYLVALSSLLLMFAWRHVRFQGPGSGLALGFCAVCIPGGALISVAMVPSGAPPGGHVLLASGALVAALVTIVLLAIAEK